MREESSKKNKIKKYSNINPLWLRKKALKKRNKAIRNKNKFNKANNDIIV